MFAYRTVILRPKLEFRCALSRIYGVGKFKALNIASRVGLAFPYHSYFLNRYIYRVLMRFMIPYVWLKVRLVRIINAIFQNW